MSENHALDLVIAAFCVFVGGSFGVAIVQYNKKTDELASKINSHTDLPSNEISLLLQSMKQEREEVRQEIEQGQQRLSSAVLRMELQLSKLGKIPTKQNP